MSVYKRGKRKRWWYRFQIRGISYAQSIPEARTKRQAIRAEARAKDAVYDGRYGNEPSSIKLSRFIDDVFIPWAKAEKRSWRNDQSRAKAIKAFFGNKAMREITQFNVREFRRARLTSSNGRGGSRSPSSVDREIQLLSRVFSLAIEQGLLKENPCSGIPLAATQTRVIDYLSQEEQAQLLPHLEGRRSHLHDIVLIDVHTGLRKTELLSLHRSQIDFVRERIILKQTKNGNERSVPIHPTIRPILQRRCREAGPNGFLFENKRTGRPIRDIKTAWTSALKDAGLRQIRFHCAGRHTFGTRAASNGANLADLQDVLGHADIKTTMLYAHATEEGKRAVVEAAGQRSRTKVVQMKRASRKAR